MSGSIAFCFFNIKSEYFALDIKGALSRSRRSKGDPTTKLGQLRISYEEHFLLKNYAQNVVRKLFPDLLLESQNWASRWVNSVNFYAVYFYCILSSGLSNYIESKLQKTCLYRIKLKKLFWKTKEALEQASPHFVHDFQRKIFILLHSINWPNVTVCLP